MKFRCNNQLFQKSVGVVEKAISSRSALPVMENIYFELSNGEMVMRANDLEVWIENRFPVEEVDRDGKVLIKSNTISSIISKLGDSSLMIDVDGSNKVGLRSQNIDFDILGTGVEEYPDFPQVEDGVTFSISVEILKDLIKHTIFSVSSDETKPFLNGILIEINNDVLNFVSTDGFRLALKKYQLTDSYKNISVIVPFKAMNELNKIIQTNPGSDQVTITVSSNQISFRLHQFLLVSRLIQGQFPDYNQVIPKNSENSYTLSRRYFVTACDRAQIIAAHANNVVRVVFQEETVLVRALAAKMGEYREELSISRRSGSGKMKISFNVKLVLDVIRILEGDDILIEFNNELSPCLIQSATDEGFTYIIMPIRTSDYEEEGEENQKADESVKDVVSAENMVTETVSPSPTPVSSE